MSARLVMVVFGTLCAVLAATGVLAGESDEQVKPGDSVVVSVEGARLMLGSEILAELPTGTRMKVVKVRDGWVGGHVLSEGESRSGWVKASQVRRSPTAESQPEEPGGTNRLIPADELDSPMFVDPKTDAMVFPGDGEIHIIPSGTVLGEEEEAAITYRHVSLEEAEIPPEVKKKLPDDAIIYANIEEGCGADVRVYEKDFDLFGGSRLHKALSTDERPRFIYLKFEKEERDGLVFTTLRNLETDKLVFEPVLFPEDPEPRCYLLTRESEIVKEYRGLQRDDPTLPAAVKAELQGEAWAWGNVREGQEGDIIVFGPPKHRESSSDDIFVRGIPDPRRTTTQEPALIYVKIAEETEEGIDFLVTRNLETGEMVRDALGFAEGKVYMMAKENGRVIAYVRSSKADLALSPVFEAAIPDDSAVYLSTEQTETKDLLVFDRAGQIRRGSYVPQAP